ncbi:type II secretion system protein [Nocardioides gansuensis]|uniref:Type II secretion system protein n=1 Tax=Nocardioides gansuensis TaxID=2138300 RepID=A0A2T8F9K7_9ACTN|nr:type II secretion system F family protein [Nocardioides gansuensis]PVG82418.1 type II secretion system protein [Nocardioides gansuensis]
MILVAAGLAGLSVLLATAPRPSLPAFRVAPATGSSPTRGAVRQVAAAGLAGVGAYILLGGALGVAAGLAAAAAAWLVLDRAEPAGVRREREAVSRDLPHLVELLAATLRAGAPPGDAVRTVAAALPGPAADRLAGVVARLSLGVAPAEVWAGLTGDPALAPLGRTLARATATGASVADAVARLADELDAEARAGVEDRARAVGVKAALPLGVCLLPAFLLVGIVPSVAGLLAAIRP